MDIKDTISSLGRALVDSGEKTIKKSSELIDSSRINIIIASKKNSMDDIFQEIGKDVYKNHQKEVSKDKDINKLFHKVETLEKEIKELKKKLLILKKEVFCPHCGEAINKKSKFCFKCGKIL